MWPGVAQRVGRCIALLFHDRRTRRGWVVSSTPRPHFTPGKDPVPILQKAGWAPGPVWTGGKSRPHRDSIPDHPARSSVAIPTEPPGPHLPSSAEVKERVELYLYPPSGPLWTVLRHNSLLNFTIASIHNGSVLHLPAHSVHSFTASKQPLAAHTAGYSHK